MKDRSNYQSVINYFRKWDGVGMLGIIMMSAGALGLWLWLWHYYVSVGLMLLGLPVFLYGNLGRANESDIRDTLQRNRDSIRFDEFEDDTQLQRRIDKTQTGDLIWEAFSVRDGLWMKRMKNGDLCTNEYNCAKLRLLSDALYIKTLTFSLTDDTKEAHTYDILLEKLEGASVLRERVCVTAANKKQYEIKVCCLMLIYDGGKSLRLPARDDIKIDDFVEQLNRKYVQQ